MRRTSLLLLAALRFYGCEAKPHSFSIHEDVLAHPEFEVVFEDGAISEKDAKRLLERNGEQQRTRSSEAAQPAGGTGDDSDDKSPSHTYELVNLGNYKCLCSIPILEATSADNNETATELARAEEAREERRAVASGWELIAVLEDTCLYFMSGWWSYSFCRNREIVQYHALASSPKGHPPKRDLHSPEYVLGRIPAISSSSSSSSSPLRKTDRSSGKTTKATTMEHELDTIPAELQEKGKQRYLVQKLEGGTICDLTDRERTIEVQYRCVPGLKSHRISWVKEVTICAYVMVIDTPLLCNDVAFLPPEPTKANAISCQLVSSEAALLLENKEAAAAAAEAAVGGKGHKAQVAADTMVELNTVEAAVNVLKELLHGNEGPAGKRRRATVGDIVVGSRNLLSAADEAGRAPFKLTPPRSFMSSGLMLEPKMQVVVATGASREKGGETTVMSREELKKLDIDPETVLEMAEKISKLAGDAAWRLEVSDSGLAGVRELKGFIDDGDDGDDEDTGMGNARAKQKQKPKQKGKQKEKQKEKREGKTTTKKTDTVEDGEVMKKKKKAEAEEEEEGEEQGSREEYFKDEL